MNQRPLLNGRQKEASAMTLKEMKIGDRGTIRMIAGGKGVHNKLESMGLREGVSIVKKSAVMNSGPVIIEVGTTQIALGCEIAGKIFVQSA
jgi:Fe2+ transport system protein FeoA